MKIAILLKAAILFCTYLQNINIKDVCDALFLQIKERNILFQFKYSITKQTKWQVLCCKHDNVF